MVGWREAWTRFQITICQIGKELHDALLTNIHDHSNQRRNGTLFQKINKEKEERREEEEEEYLFPDWKRVEFPTLLGILLSDLARDFNNMQHPEILFLLLQERAITYLHPEINRVYSNPKYFYKDMQTLIKLGLVREGSIDTSFEALRPHKSKRMIGAIRNPAAVFMLMNATEKDRQKASLDHFNAIRGTLYESPEEALIYCRITRSEREMSICEKCSTKCEEYERRTKKVPPYAFGKYCEEAQSVFSDTPDTPPAQDDGGAGGNNK